MLPPEWLIDSAKAGKWLDEAEYSGWRSTATPLANKRIAFDATLYQQKEGQSAKLLETLIDLSENSKLVMADLAHPHSFDYVVMGTEATAADKEKWPRNKQVLYDTLMVTTHSPVPADAMLHRCSMFGC